MMRIGYGSDKHELAAGERLVLGGVDVSGDLGAVGHSDADAVLHAVTDALLGAIAAGDIGAHFPSSDERWKNADSEVFLRHALSLVREKGYEVGNIDVTIHLELPKLRPFIDEMRAKTAEMLSVDIGLISIKAKTGEGIGEIGERKAVLAEAVVLITKAE
jgi:2-C-methyl-D-erythritol 2,4-cyclodiphosphate synthase